MTAPHASQIINGYLARLESDTADIPRSQRQEVIQSVREHIAEARATLADETDADILNILDRLGDPAELAIEERERLGRPEKSPPRTGVLEITALVLTPLFWPIGVILLTVSNAWSTRDKLIGALLPPGGLFTSFFIFAYMFAGNHCSQGYANGRAFNTCPPPWVGMLLLGAALLILLLPIFTSIYLGTRLRRIRSPVAT